MIKFNCPSCGKSVTAPDSAGGKRGKCPDCKGMLLIPPSEGILNTDDFEVVDDAPPARSKPAAISARPRPAEDIPVAEAVEDDPDDRPARSRRRRDDDYDDEDDYDDRPRRKRSRRRGPRDGTPMGRGGYAICYNCGADAASRVGFTWWGGLIGPSLLSHVRCDRCGTTYNGKSGRSNNTAIAIYVGVSFAIGIGIMIMAIIAEAGK